MDRAFAPPLAEIECYDVDAGRNDMPVYTGPASDAFMSIEAGIYPGSYIESALGKATQVNVILVVTDDESFAVTTAVTYTGPMPIDVESNNGF